MELIRKQTTDHRPQTTDKGRKAEGKGSGVRGQGCDHGGNVYQAARDLGIPDSRIMDFSASINPLGISGRVRAAIADRIDRLVHYPDPGADELRTTVSRLHRIDAGMVLPGNGSTELIYLVPRALKPRSVLVPSPTFSEYERACRVGTESSVKRYALRKENSFQISTDAFIDAMQGCDMAFLCNPNNPTGHTLRRKEVLHIADAARDAGCVLVVDEAFIDFTPEHSVLNDVTEYPGMIVLRSLTKFYALTGLRIGYSVSSGEVRERMTGCKEPWSVNSLAQAAAAAALDDRDYRNETAEVMAREKAYLEAAFHDRGITFFPSSVNYYLLHMDRAEDVVITLREKGILVRSCSNFRGLDKSYIRIAVRTREQNECLLKELAAL